MKNLLITAGLLTLCRTSAAGEVATWRGDALGAWTNRTLQCRDLRVDGGVLKGVVTGRDAQLYAPLPAPLAPRGNHRVHLRARTAVGGRAQLFWIRAGDAMASESRQKSFELKGDGAWHDYSLVPNWCGTQSIVRLRLDLPAEMEGGSPFEIAEVRVDETGEEIDVDTAGKIGVAFSLRMPRGHHYCTLTWSGDEAGAGEFGFTPATDGERHSYWFDLRQARVRGWGPDRGRPCWKGRIRAFNVEQAREGLILPAADLAFVAARPDTPADPSVTSARPAEAIPRTGRPFPVEVVVRNFGTRPAKNIRFAFDGLPAGAHPLDPAELAPADELPGAAGDETIWNDCRPPLAGERVYVIRLSDLGPGERTIGLTLTADGVAPRRTEIRANVLPSLGLPPAAYPPEPRPVSTAPYEIGAFLFPGWTSHRWHAVWSHAPERKPVLGWYDEESPETVDWQIRHLVENGVSFVSVDWYWDRGRQHLNHWMKSFREARYRRYLKWSLMWANHNARGSHSVADQERVTRFWVENYFGDPQYQTIDGLPVVTIWSSAGMETDMAGQGGCRALLEVSQRVARAAGYKGIFFIAVRGPDTESAEFLRTFKDRGFDMTCVYKYMGGIAGAPSGPAGSRPYRWLADTSLAHWRALKRNSAIPFLPSLSTGWDDRPWRGESGWAITGLAAADFRRVCGDARTYSDETGDRMLMLGPLDEWGEGSIGYPNAEHGFGLLEAVRDTFAQRPADGWPVNFAPEDVGLVCPRRPRDE